MSVVSFIVARRLHFETTSRRLAEVGVKGGGLTSRLRRLVEGLATLSPFFMVYGLGFDAYLNLTLNYQWRLLSLLLMYFVVTGASAYLLFEPPTSSVCTDNRLNRSIVRQLESDFLMISVAWSTLFFVTVTALYALHTGAVSEGDKGIFAAEYLGVVLATLGVGPPLIRRGLSRQLRKFGMETTP